MIFVAVGTQKFQFDRLIRQVDECIESGIIKEEVFGQIGNSTYLPKNYRYSRNLSPAEFGSMINKSRILITHSGVGTIIQGIQNSIPVIVVPRLEKFGEHIDDHQVQIAEAFEERQFILKCDDITKLSEAIIKAEYFSVKEYVSNRKNIIKVLQEYINQLRGELR